MAVSRQFNMKTVREVGSNHCWVVRSNRCPERHPAYSGN